MVYKSVDDTASASFCLHLTLEYLNMIKQTQGCKPTSGSLGPAAIAGRNENWTAALEDWGLDPR